MSESTHPAAPLELLDVVVGYRKDRPPVIDSLTARFEPASLTHLGGANGRGKTTLLELASGYLRPWAGSVAVGGHEASSEAARSLRRVCRTQPALYPSMTAMEHLEFAALCAGQSVDVALDRAQAYELSPGSSTRLGSCPRATPANCGSSCARSVTSTSWCSTSR